jgi:tight adherence protein B
MNPITILIVGGGFALLLLIIGIVVTIRNARSIVDERLEEIVTPDEPEYFTPEDKKPASSPITDWLNRRVEGSSFSEKVSKNLAQADIKLKAGEYVALLIISALGSGMIFWVIGGGLTGDGKLAAAITGFIGVAVGLLLPGLFVKRAQGKRLENFDNQLGDMINLMVNGLRAGYSTAQAMEAVSKELPSPISVEFRRVVQEMQLGISMDQAMDNLLRRIPSPDLDLIITAINVQREVGGNLAEILDTISHTIRERVRIKGEIKTLTTQVMYSGRFLSLMPILVMGVLYLFNKPYMMQFFSEENNAKLPCGYCALGLAAVMIILGYFAMTKLGEIEI